MTRTEIAKRATRMTTQFAVTRCVVSIIGTNVPITRPSDKVAVWVGAFVLSSMAADAAGDYTDKMIDELVAAFQKEDTKS